MIKKKLHRLKKAKVVKVSDGDTITILTSDKKQVKIRLSGIDCPESKQDFGTKAKQFTASFCFAKNVRVEVVGQDRYNRSLGVVLLDNGQNLNKALLEAGLAWHYKYFDDSKELSQLEQSARANKIGLWSMKDPIAPWEFRKLSRASF
jgi:micrococcal nuclease